MKRIRTFYFFIACLLAISISTRANVAKLNSPNNPNINSLINSLHHDENWKIRKQAACTLIYYSSTCDTPSIVGSPIARTSVLQTVISALIVSLQNERDTRVIKTIRYSLNCALKQQKYKPPSNELSQIIRLLKTSTHKTVRETSAFILGRISSHKTLIPLIAALKDSEEGVRREAVEALGRKNAPEAVKALINLLKGDADKNVRYEAAAALISSANPFEVSIRFAMGLPCLDNFLNLPERHKSKPEIISALISALKEDKSSLVRNAAAYALGYIYNQDTRIVNALIAALRDNSEDVREYSALSLALIRTPKVISELKKIVVNNKERSEVREAAKFALKKIKS